MTTIRKIVTSKIDGDTANNTSIDEIRPFGETAFYLDQNFETQKLTLMMFDGQRTHRESKVLAPGVLWGSSADSGDGNNYDTIKLIPDAELFANGSNQYLIVDPTNGSPGHIHIRAGGTQDSSSADLYLGGEQTFVRVSDTYDNVSIGTTGTNANSWIFDSDGALTLPSTSTIFTNETELNIATSPTTTYTFNQAYWEALNGNASRMLTPTGNSQYFSCTVTAQQDGTYTVDITGAGNSFVADNWFKIPGNELGGSTSTNDLQITVATVGGGGEILTVIVTGSAVGKQWTFGTDGTVTLPGGGVIDGADYDVTITAGDDGSSTYGHVTLKTNGPNGVNEFYMNSLGELNLPRGGVIQETLVINEAFGTTTTSLTLVPAGAANGTQRLEIYGTIGGEGDHIHITSGDQNQTDLYLGNDTQYFAVGAMGQVEVRARPGLDSPTTGTSAYAGSPVWIYAGDAGNNGGNTVDGAPGGDVLISAGAASAGVGGDVLLYSGNGPTGYGSIKLSTNGYGNYLEFNKNDQLTFPSGGSIVFDSSATSTITGVSEVIFADGTTQTSAWLAGTVSSVETNSLTTFIPETGTFTNTNQLTVSHQAHAADVGFTFTIDYQSPLDETKGVTVGAINTPLILSTGSVKVRADLSTSTEWTFGTNGVLTLPVGGDIKNSTGTSVLATLYLLEAYANVTYTLPGSFTEDVCRYSVVSDNVNVPSAWFNTSTYTFTPLKAGYWEITATYDVYRNAEASMVIKKNTSIVASAGSFNAVAQQVTKIVYLNGSTDYIQIYNFGGAALERSQYDGRSWFQARWVGN